MVHEVAVEPQSNSPYESMGSVYLLIPLAPDRLAPNPKRKPISSRRFPLTHFSLARGMRCE